MLQRIDDIDQIGNAETILAEKLIMADSDRRFAALALLRAARQARIGDIPCGLAPHRFLRSGLLRRRRAGQGGGETGLFLHFFRPTAPKGSMALRRDAGGLQGPGRQIRLWLCHGTPLSPSPAPSQAIPVPFSWRRYSPFRDFPRPGRFVLWSARNGDPPHWADPRAAYRETHERKENPSMRR